MYLEMKHVLKNFVFEMRTLGVNWIIKRRIKIMFVKGNCDNDLYQQIAVVKRNVV